MLSTVLSSNVFGMETTLVEIEVDLQRGLPAIQIVGLPDTMIKESKERIRSAIIHSGFDYPKSKIVVNLAPAHLKKVGALFDLAITIGILHSSQQIKDPIKANCILLGELGLSGELRAVHGVLPIINMLAKHDFESIIVPYQNRDESALNNNVNSYPVKTLNEAISVLTSDAIDAYHVDINSLFQNQIQHPIDFSEVKGQYKTKRALEIASAGGHNILMVGPPGCGKSMMAKRIPGILPDLTVNEAFETTEIYSSAGILGKKQSLVTQRPFRSPHHTSSDIALIGGGGLPKPGEVSLAHNGILFLDELVEFKKSALQSLREPLENQYITISRADYTANYPARFMLVGAMNPCACGYLNHPKIACICSKRQIQYYISKLSGPLLDRIDIQVQVEKLENKDLFQQNKSSSESSQQIKERVQMAHNIQLNRFHDIGIVCNAQMIGRMILEFCPLNTATQNILCRAVDKLNLSARGYDKVIKVARTISDLNGVDVIGVGEILEAVQYQCIDRLYHG